MKIGGSDTRKDQNWSAAVFSCDPCGQGARQTNIGSSSHLATQRDTTKNQVTSGWGMALKIIDPKNWQNQFPSRESQMPGSIATPDFGVSLLFSPTPNCRMIGVSGDMDPEAWQ